jgi:AraC family transcriptional regulator
LRLIEERLQSLCEAPTLQALADLCGISVRHLARGFRGSKGVTIGTYVACSQIEHAKRLLAADASVSAVAGKLGFASSANFCHSFRRSTGLKPGQYRRRMLWRQRADRQFAS